MTLDEMDDYFELLLAETSASSDFVSTAQKYDLINEGCLVFQEATHIVRPATPYQSVTLATGTAGYDLSSNFLAVMEGVFLFNASSEYQKEILPQSGGYREFILNDSDNGEPASYVIMGMTKAADTSAPVSKIIIDPPPSSTFNNYIARVYYASIPLTLDETTDVSDIPVHFHRAPVIIAVALYKERDQEFDQAKYYWDKANSWINRAKRDLYSRDKSVTGWRWAKGQYADRG